MNKLYLTIFILVVIFLIAFSCNLFEKETETIYDTIYIHPDTVFTDITCYECLDSVWALKVEILDSLYQGAMDEVQNFRDLAIAQVDSMREDLYSLADSIQDLHVHDNLIIRGDTASEVEARFDSITGKPYLIINN